MGLLARIGQVKLNRRRIIALQVTSVVVGWVLTIFWFPYYVLATVAWYIAEQGERAIDYCASLAEVCRRWREDHPE